MSVSAHITSTEINSRLSATSLLVLFKLTPLTPKQIKKRRKLQAKSDVGLQRVEASGRSG